MEALLLHFGRNSYKEYMLWIHHLIWRGPEERIARQITTLDQLLRRIPSAHSFAPSFISVSYAVSIMWIEFYEIARHNSAQLERAPEVGVNVAAKSSSRGYHLTLPRSLNLHAPKDKSIDKNNT